VTDNPKRTTLTIGNFLGWLLASLSMVNIIDDLDLITLQEKLARWIHAYDAFVQQMFVYCFGWIDILWFHISEAETHLLIIFSIVLTNSMRSAMSVPEEDRFRVGCFGIFGYMFAILFIGFIPTILSAVFFPMLSCGFIIGVLIDPEETK